jgi:hypothetical protein
MRRNTSDDSPAAAPNQSKADGLGNTANQNTMVPFMDPISKRLMGTLVPFSVHLAEAGPKIMRRSDPAQIQKLLIYSGFEASGDNQSDRSHRDSESTAHRFYERVRDMAVAVRCQQLKRFQHSGSDDDK